MKGMFGSHGRSCPEFCVVCGERDRRRGEDRDGECVACGGDVFALRLFEMGDGEIVADVALFGHVDWIDDLDSPVTDSYVLYWNSQVSERDTSQRAQQILKRIPLPKGAREITVSDLQRWRFLPPC